LKTNIVIFSTLLIATSAWAQAPAATPAPAGSPAPVKVATIHVQNALLTTKDGQKAAQDLQTKFNPRRQELEKKNTEITNIQAQMRAGSATMSEAAKSKLAGDYDRNTKELKRASDDFDAEVQQEENKIMGVLGQQLMDVLVKYTTSHQIAVVVDVSSQQSPVLWADPSIDITNEVVKLYDSSHPAAPGSAPAAPAAPPSKKQ